MESEAAHRVRTQLTDLDLQQKDDLSEHGLTAKRYGAYEG